MLRRLRDEMAHRTGVVIGKYPTYWSPEYHLREVLRGSRTDLVLDVGAFRGDYGTELRRLRFSGRIISFEPTPESYAALAARADGDSLWTVERTALGSKPGTLELHVHADRGNLNSALRVSQEASDAWGISDSVTEAVPVTTLDAFCAEHALDLSSYSTLLKIDTQGYDMEVIAGAAASLPLVTALQAELPLRATYEGGPDFFASLAHLQALGFALSNIAPIARFGLAVAEVDCLLVREPAG